MNFAETGNYSNYSNYSNNSRSNQTPFAHRSDRSARSTHTPISPSSSFHSGRGGGGDVTGRLNYDNDISFSNGNTPNYQKNNYNDSSAAAGGSASGKMSFSGGEEEIIDIGNSGGMNQTLQDLDRLYRYWCIVIGIFADNFRMDKIRDTFDRNAGVVVDVMESSGNWVLVKFNSPEEAKKAMAAYNNTLISNGTMLAVNQLDTNQAQNMNLQLDTDGNFVGGVGGLRDGNSLLGSSYSRASADDMRLMQAKSEGDMPNFRQRSSVDKKATGDNAARAPSMERIKRHPSGLKVTSRGGAVDPASYLVPVQRESVCNMIMQFFGFQ